MEPFIIMAVLIIVAVVIFMFFKFRSNNRSLEEASGSLGVVDRKSVV